MLRLFTLILVNVASYSMQQELPLNHSDRLKETLTLNEGSVTSLTSSSIPLTKVYANNAFPRFEYMKNDIGLPYVNLIHPYNPGEHKFMIASAMEKDIADLIIKDSVTDHTSVCFVIQFVDPTNPQQDANGILALKGYQTVSVEQPNQMYDALVASQNSVGTTKIFTKVEIKPFLSNKDMYEPVGAGLLYIHDCRDAWTKETPFLLYSPNTLNIKKNGKWWTRGDIEKEDHIVQTTIECDGKKYVTLHYLIKYNGPLVSAVSKAKTFEELIDITQKENLCLADFLKLMIIKEEWSNEKNLLIKNK